VTIWHTVPLTVVLYGAAATHVVLAIFAIYERRTFKLPAIELLRIALGLWLPVMLIGHAITTRLEFELIGSPATYARIISNLWASNGEWQHMGLLAPGWMLSRSPFRVSPAPFVVSRSFRAVWCCPVIACAVGAGLPRDGA